MFICQSCMSISRIIFTEMKGREDRAAHLFSNTVDTHELDSQGFEEIDLYDKVN